MPMPKSELPHALVAAHEKVQCERAQSVNASRHGGSCLSLESDVWWSSWLCIPALMSVWLEEGLNGNSDLVWTDGGQ